MKTVKGLYQAKFSVSKSIAIAIAIAVVMLLSMGAYQSNAAPFEVEAN